MRLILDTSAAANIVLQTPLADALITVVDQAQLVIAPTLLQSELANTLWKQVRFSGVGRDQAISLFQDGIGLVDEFVADQELAVQALSLAVKHQHPAYDMFFVALAMRFGGALLTVDIKLKNIATNIDPLLVVNV
jgi:predicted nucleic acid-binding protein